MFGSTACTPASKPAWNLRMSGMSTPPMKPTVPVLDFSAAAAPTRNEPSCSAKTSPARLSPPSGALSMMPKSVSGLLAATSAMDSPNRKPTPITSSAPSAESCRSSARLEPSGFGEASVVLTPNSAAALSSPAAAESLNDWSPRPPMSNTSAAVMSSAPGGGGGGGSAGASAGASAAASSAAGAGASAAPSSAAGAGGAVVVGSSSPPQAAATMTVASRIASSPVNPRFIVSRFSLRFSAQGAFALSPCAADCGRAMP